MQTRARKREERVVTRGERRVRIRKSETRLVDTAQLVLPAYFDVEER